MMASVSAIIEHLDGISRRRALTLAESVRLERAIKAEGEVKKKRNPREVDWRPEEDELILILRRKKIRAHKLTFGDIADILKIAGISPSQRSYWSVAARMRLLRKVAAK